MTATACALQANELHTRANFTIGRGVSPSLPHPRPIFFFPASPWRSPLLLSGPRGARHIGIALDVRPIPNAPSPAQRRPHRKARAPRRCLLVDQPGHTDTSFAYIALSRPPPWQGRRARICRKNPTSATGSIPCYGYPLLHILKLDFIVRKGRERPGVFSSTSRGTVSCDGLTSTIVMRRGEKHERNK